MNKTLKYPSTEAEKQVWEDKKKLAIARLKAIPKDFQISIGGEGKFSRDEVIQNIIDDSEIGQEMVDIQIEFLKDMASGNIYNFFQ